MHPDVIMLRAFVVPNFVVRVVLDVLCFVEHLSQVAADNNEVTSRYIAEERKI